MKMITKFFNDEITPADFGRLLNEAHHIIALYSLQHENAGPNAPDLSELLHYLHKFEQLLYTEEKSPK